MICFPVQQELQRLQKTPAGATDMGISVRVQMVVIRAIMFPKWTFSFPVSKIVPIIYMSPFGHFTLYGKYIEACIVCLWVDK